tara:strand:- start:1689 stop:2147 length:459 start_codon:yes stop_codon:yes gene_type:complete
MANPLYGQNKADNKLDDLAAAYASTSTLLSKNVRMGVKHYTDFSAVANDDVIMAIPADSLIVGVTVINTHASEAFAVATSLNVEAGVDGDVLSADLKTLAAGVAEGGSEDADVPYYWAAGGNLVFAGGTNSTAADTTATVIVDYIPSVSSIS